MVELKMEDARSYMVSTAPASEGLFKLLNQYGWHKMRSFVDMTKSKSREELNSHKSNFSSVDTAREIIAGSILQIAYIAIKQYAVFKDKSANARHFESEMNRLMREHPNPRSKNDFSLPDAFCVGREIGHLPLGLVVYAARNQYNHLYEDRLNVVNEVVFNHLNTIWPNPANGLSFNLYDGNHYYCYSALAALGWTDNAKGLGYAAYKSDLSEVLQVEF